MKKTTRYTWKPQTKAKAAPAVASAESSPEATESSAAATSTAPATESTPATTEIAAPASEPAPETAEGAAASEPGSNGAAAPATAEKSAPAALTFDTLEEARTYLLANAKDKVVRQVESARFHGKIAESLPPGEIRRATEGALERQRRFPLDTANALRGRLRRERFTIFKKGSKGISYVCAVKRKFRVPGQAFAESIGALISFIEAHPMIRASELTTKFLGIKLPAAAKATGAAPSTETTEVPPAPEPALSVDDRAKISRMQGDLRWLVAEGYVTEFIDGRLFAPPPVAESRKKEVEAEEHDPENFPEAPVSAPPFEGKAPEAAPPAAAETPSAPVPSEAPPAETASHTD